MAALVLAGAASAPFDAQALLEEKDAEIARLQQRLEALDDQKVYAEALQLGVVRALERSSLSDAQRRRLAIAIVRDARANSLDPLLVVAVIRTESAFDAFAESPVGALGLMQVMPETGKWLVSRRGMALRRAKNLFDLELNVELGTAYLAALIEEFGSVDEALVAYNAGPGAAKKILANRAARRRFLAGYPRTVLHELDRLKQAESLSKTALNILPESADRHW